DRFTTTFEDRGQQLLWVLFDRSSVEIPRTQLALGHRDDPVVVDDDRFGTRGPLVAGEDGHSDLLLATARRTLRPGFLLLVRVRRPPGRVDRPALTTTRFRPSATRQPRDCK